MSVTEILDVVFTHINLGETTLRECFCEIVTRVWTENEEFRGKYALGDSDWQVDIYRLLIQQNLISGTIDENGDVEVQSYIDVNEVISKLIRKAIYS